MSMTLDDVIMLAKAGYSKNDIAAFMNLGNPQTQPPAVPPVQQAAQVQAPDTQATPAPVQQAAPAQPDYSAQLAAISARLDAMAVPTAGAVGNPPTVTSVEDIIRASFMPKQAEPAPQQ